MKDYTLTINGHTYNVQIDEINEASTLARVTVNGTAYEVEIGGGKAAAQAKPQVAAAPKAANSAQITPQTAAPSAPVKKASAAAAGAIKCPLPGTVMAVKVSVGDTVAAGQTLLVLEAMKMENNIDSDRAGVVKEICVQQGATVMEGDNLIVIE
ncbi:MAG: biotin/lipoyl-containing protein [Rikenellaceae bacterium]|nr:biotin/lipoyl-containing protein [Rikenellaceae bacterium]